MRTADQQYDAGSPASANRWRNLIRVGLLAVATVGGGSGYYVLSDVTVAQLGPLATATGQRIAGAVLIFLAAGLARFGSRATPQPPTTASQRTALILLSLTNVALLGCVVFGFTYSTPTNAALIDRLDLPLALIVGSLFLGEPARRLDWLLMVPLATGVLLVLEIWPGHIQAHVLGDMLFLTATTIMVGNAVLIRRMMAGVRSWTITRWNVNLSALWFVLLCLAVGGTGSLGALLSPRAALLSFGLGVLILVEMTAYYVLLRRLTVWHVRCVLLFIPVATVFIEHLRSALALSPTQWVGAAVVVVCLSAILATHRRSPPVRRPSMDARSMPASEPST